MIHYYILLAVILENLGINIFVPKFEKIYFFKFIQFIDDIACST